MNKRRGGYHEIIDEITLAEREYIYKEIKSYRNVAKGEAEKSDARYQRLFRARVGERYDHADQKIDVIDSRDDEKRLARLAEHDKSNRRADSTKR